MKCNEMLYRSRQVCSIQEKIVMARRDGPKVLYLEQISINNGIYYLKEHHEGCRSLFSFEDKSYKNSTQRLLNKILL